MNRIKPFIACLFVVSVTLTGCSPTPEELASESKRLHEELATCRTQADSANVYREIAALETRARSEFNKTELKEYERLAHPND